MDGKVGEGWIKVNGRMEKEEKEELKGWKSWGRKF